MIVPTDPPYGPPEYARDGARAFWHKVRYEHRLYWPPYHGPKVKWNWATAAEWTLTLTVVLIVVEIVS